MATMLVELGSTQLVELGRARVTPDAAKQIIEAAELTAFMEDPFAGIEDDDLALTPRQKAIGEKLRTLSRMRRRMLAPDSGLAGISMGDVARESADLARALNELSHEEYVELGKLLKKIKKKAKKIGKQVKKVGKKVVKVVKSPAFLAVAGCVANVIPGVGQIVSAGLLAASAAMEMRKRQKAAKKGEAYEENPIETLVTSVARPIAAGMAFPRLAKDANALFGSVTGDFAKQYPDLAKQFDVGKLIMDAGKKLVPGLQAQGEQSFLTSTLKSLGQFGAIDSLVKGTGLKDGVGNILGGGAPVSTMMETIKTSIPSEASDAGKQDLLNVAAAAGELKEVEEGIERGESSEFPIIPVALGAGGFLVFITVLSIVTRR